MTKKGICILILLSVVLGMVGCSGSKQPAAASENSQSQTMEQMDLSKQPVENKLAIGILSLEGTDKAVTAEEAKNLLPLWKAVRSLGNSTTASDDEITALFAQIQETMTAEQVQAIKDLNLSQEEMRALMEKYGGDIGGDRQGLDPQNMTDEQKATLEALRQSNNQGNGGSFPGGNRPEGGIPPGSGDMPPGGGGMQGGGFAGGGTMPNAQGTPSADQALRRPTTGGLNLMLAEAVIQLLEERTGG